MQFNKILNPVYSTIASFSIQEDGSINAKYVVGSGADSGDSVTDFTPITSEYKWIDGETANAIMDKPLTKEETSKSLKQVMIDRIYAHLKENSLIVI